MSDLYTDRHDIAGLQGWAIAKSRTRVSETSSSS